MTDSCFIIIIIVFCWFFFTTSLFIVVQWQPLEIISQTQIKLRIHPKPMYTPYNKANRKDSPLRACLKTEQQHDVLCFTNALFPWDTKSLDKATN